MKIKFIALAGIVLFFFFGCEKDKNSTGPATSTVTDIPKLSSLFTIEFADYDSMVVRSREGIHLMPGSITRIEMGDRDTGEFSVLESVIPSYQEQAGENLFSFTLSHKIANEKLKSYFFTLRFWQGEDFADIDTFALTYKFPYKTTEIFLETNQFSYPPFYPQQELHVQDFELVGEQLYFYNIGLTYLWKFDLNSGKLEELQQIGSGDHVTGNSTYLFLDLWHSEIHRYDISRDTMDIKFPLPDLKEINIYGLDVYDGQLYAMFQGESSDKSLLAIYDFQGNLLDQQLIPIAGGYLTVQDNILYTIDWRNLRILRYDLSSESTLADIRFPAESTEGIKIYGDKFYFVDYSRQVISVASLADIISGSPGASEKLTRRHFQRFPEIKPLHEEEDF